ncbi:MAG: limonene-1,2-epoxide hydrolase family protein [Sporichthyaceae bacterium]
MAQDLVPIVEELFAAWGKDWDSFLQSYRDHLAPDGVYIAHPNIPAVVGPNAAIEILAPFRSMGVESIDVEFSKIVQVGDDVWTERIDYMKNAKGERYLPIPIGAVFTFNAEGKISRWADYWDMQQVVAAATPAQ